MLRRIVWKELHITFNSTLRIERQNRPVGSDNPVPAQQFIGLIDGIAQIFFGSLIVLIFPENSCNLLPIDCSIDMKIVKQGIDFGKREKDSVLDRKSVV